MPTFNTTPDVFVVAVTGENTPESVHENTQRALSIIKEALTFQNSRVVFVSRGAASGEDLAAAAVFFLSEQSRFCTGQVLAIDGGWSVSEGQYE